MVDVDNVFFSQVLPKNLNFNKYKRFFLFSRAITRDTFNCVSYNFCELFIVIFLCGLWTFMVRYEWWLVFGEGNTKPVKWSTCESVVK